jgi:hypothetical protein
MSRSGPAHRTSRRGSDPLSKNRLTVSRGAAHCGAETCSARTRNTSFLEGVSDCDPGFCRTRAARLGRPATTDEVAWASRPCRRYPAGPFERGTSSSHSAASPPHPRVILERSEGPTRRHSAAGTKSERPPTSPRDSSAIDLTARSFAPLKDDTRWELSAGATVTKSRRSVEKCWQQRESSREPCSADTSGRSAKCQDFASA